MKKGFKLFLLIIAIIFGIITAFFFMDKEKLKSYVTDSRVFITGNLHGKMGIERLSDDNFKGQNLLTRNDNLIILGDFGLIWDKNIEDEYILDNLAKKNYNILFVDGTRENFDLLNNNYEVVNLYGGKVHKIRDNIFHLIRGEIYTIGGKQYLAFGGGESEDKDYRTEGIDYWIDEMPTADDWDNLKTKLDKHNGYVDYILTHTPPSSDLRIIGATLGQNLGKGSELNKYLEQLANEIKYKKWFHGYYHLDLDISRKHFSVYNQIIEVK